MASAPEPKISQSSPASPTVQHQALRVDPKYPLPSPLKSSPSSQRSPHANEGSRAQEYGSGRTNSQRRRISGSGQSYTNGSAPTEILPAAPDVPREPHRGPPISYRDPYSNGDTVNPVTTSARSFAARVGAIPDNVDPTLANAYAASNMPSVGRSGHSRRGSINKSTDRNVAQTQQTVSASDSSPSVNPVSPVLPSNATTPKQQHRTSESRAIPPAVDARSSSTYTTDTSPPMRSGSRRASGTTADPRVEWAADRSPLQKLEVKLNDISKEEKRARVQEAEQLLKESRAPNAGRQATLDTEHPVRRASSTRAAKSIVDNGKDGNVSQQRRRLSSQNNGYAGREDQLPGSQHQTIARTQSQKTRRSSLNDPNGIHEDNRTIRFQNDQYPGDPVAVSSIPVPTRHNSNRKARTDAGTESTHPHLREERKGLVQTSQNSGTDGRVRSERLQQKPLQQQQPSMTNAEVSHKASSAAYGELDAAPGHAALAREHALKYQVPPQTAAGINARQRNGFGSREGAPPRDTSTDHKHRTSKLLHFGHHGSHTSPVPRTEHVKHFDDWKQGRVARLTLADFVSDTETSKDNTTWWETQGPGSQRRRDSLKLDDRSTAGFDGSYEDHNGKAVDSSFRSSSSTPFDTVEARQYIDDEGTLRVQRRNHSWLRKLFFVQRPSVSEGKQNTSVAFRYSLIRKPYVDKRLTRSMRNLRIRVPAAPTTFNPPLYLKCGPLLRYTGLRRDGPERSNGRGDSAPMGQEVWRGSVMIVTTDAQSSYDPAPKLRLFHQPIDLLPPPPQHADGGDNQPLPSEYIDPIAGLPKMSRTGATVYVKPAEDLDEEKDVSRIETDDGLFEETRTANVPTAYGKADELLGRSPLLSVGKNRRNQRSGPGSSKFREVTAVRLHAERGLTFWRFNLEVELGIKQARIAYRINNAASIGFWVPARGRTMNMMFHSCNGFSMSVDPNHFSGPDPLWRDFLNSHQMQPFHVMIGGGDQIYNDAVMRDTAQFKEWLSIKNPHRKHEAPFTPEMQEELESFYLDRYSMWFSQGLFGMANSQIPMINVWDDHDIIDGYGSYPHHFMSTPVFTGIGSVAFKYYMLFQHQSVVDETTADEPSWLLGASPGPYINELSRSIFMFLGKRVAFLGLDCRTERMREEVLSAESYTLVFDRCRKEIIEGETKHLIVLLGVPIAYPRLVWLENLLTSRIMDPIKALGRTGILGGFLNQFDGGVEILDDLDDHWTAKNHKHERNWFIQELQELAAEKSVRVTILGGDVHLAAIGQFYSNPKLHIPKDKDHRYMPNVISSAIVNTPPPEMMGDILNKRNKVHHLDRDTDEDMIAMFSHDTDGKPRNNKRLLPRRNWCSIKEYHPGSTPPPTPSTLTPSVSEESVERPPNRLQRTLSLTQGDSKPANLLRRLSRQDSSKSPYASSAPSSAVRSPSDNDVPDHSVPFHSNKPNGTSPRVVSAPIPIRPVSNFHRRPTNLSEKAVAKGGAGTGEINLEHGLDIVLNCEVSQKNPAGTTSPYRLLVPALWYFKGSQQHEVRKESWFKRLGSRRGTTASAGTASTGPHGTGEWGQSQTESENDFDEKPTSAARAFHNRNHQQPVPTRSILSHRNHEEGQYSGRYERQREHQYPQPYANDSPDTGHHRGGGALGARFSSTDSAPAMSPQGSAYVEPEPNMGPRQRMGSKFDRDWNSSFFGTMTENGGGGGGGDGGGGGGGDGYGGIDAYKVKERGWRRIFS